MSIVNSAARRIVEASCKVAPGATVLDRVMNVDRFLVMLTFAAWLPLMLLFHFLLFSIGVVVVFYIAMATLLVAVGINRGAYALVAASGVTDLPE